MVYRLIKLRELRAMSLKVQICLDPWQILLNLIVTPKIDKFKLDETKLFIAQIDSDAQSAMPLLQQNKVSTDTPTVFTLIKLSRKYATDVPETRSFFCATPSLICTQIINRINHNS